MMTLPSSVLPFRLLPSPLLGRAVVFAVLALLVCVPAVLPADPPPAAAAPPVPVGLAAGSLVIVGGGAPLPDAIRDRFLELAGGPKAHLVVIPTASDKAERPELLKTPGYFQALHLASVITLHAHTRDQANDPAFVKPLTEATAVWLTGGIQSRLIDTYRGTLAERELRNVLARGGVIAGTSAGAAVMTQVMILGGNPTALVGTGFGFLPGIVVDQHFQNRHRLDRLLGVLAKYPQCPGVGIDERTAIVVTGHTLTVVGEGEVRVCLPALGKTERSVQVLKRGDHIDLAELCRAALTRLQPVPASAKPAAP